MQWFARLQRRLIYFPVRRQAVDPATAGVRNGILQTVTTRTSDGLTLSGWRARPHAPETSPPLDQPRVVLYLPGNNGDRGLRVPELQALIHRGLTSYLFDYRGYAENSGRPSEEGLQIDARAAWQFLTESEQIDPRRIIVYGESLGGAVAVRLVADLCRAGVVPHGLILRSTFASLVETGQYTVKVLPVKYLLYDRFESIEHIPAVTCPILQFHGARDRRVPLAHGVRLFNAAPAASANGVPKRMVQLPQARHHDVLLRGGLLMREALITFLEETAAADRAGRDGSCESERACVVVDRSIEV